MSKRTIEEITRDMLLITEYVNKEVYDEEIAHGNADDLLIEALESICDRQDVERLIDAYHSVPKWYS
jgi:hypothetical protein